MISQINLITSGNYIALSGALRRPSTVHGARTGFLISGFQGFVALERPREVEITVERELVDAAGVPRRWRLSARFPMSADGVEPTAAELAAAYRDLDQRLERARAEAGLRGPAARAERSLEELVETYRPRQAELVEMLLADGELTEHEAELLRSAVAGSRPRAPVPAAPSAPGSTEFLAAMPLANDRTPATARSVPELIATYQIGSLKQAGAVRARRQISYDEYMALKHHFAEAERAESAASPP
jgi:hypothetical protein